MYPYGCLTLTLATVLPPEQILRSALDDLGLEAEYEDNETDTPHWFYATLFLGQLSICAFINPTRILDPLDELFEANGVRANGARWIDVDFNTYHDDTFATNIPMIMIILGTLMLQHGGDCILRDEGYDYALLVKSSGNLVVNNAHWYWAEDAPDQIGIPYSRANLPDTLDAVEGRPTEDDSFSVPDRIVPDRHATAEAAHRPDIRDEPKSKAERAFALNDADFNVRMNAASVLGQIGDASAEADLNLVLDDPVRDVQSVAARALIGVAYRKGPEYLVQSLRHRHYLVRARAADALRELAKWTVVGGVVDALAEALEDPNEYVRARVAYGLHDIGGAECVPALVNALSRSTSQARTACIYALGNIGDGRAVPALALALASSTGGVRKAAAYALGQIGGSAAIAALVDATKDSWRDVRASAVSALAKIQDRLTVPALVEALQDPASEVRTRASEALGEIGDSSAVAALNEAQFDSDHMACLAAMRALARIAGELGTELIVSKLTAPSRHLRFVAAECLGERGDVWALPALLTALNDPDQSFRSAAQRAIDRIRSSS